MSCEDAYQVQLPAEEPKGASAPNEEKCRVGNVPQGGCRREGHCRRGGRGGGHPHGLTRGGWARAGQSRGDKSSTRVRQPLVLLYENVGQNGVYLRDVAQSVPLIRCRQGRVDRERRGGARSLQTSHRARESHKSGAWRPRRRPS